MLRAGLAPKCKGKAGVELVLLARTTVLHFAFLSRLALAKTQANELGIAIVGSVCVNQVLSLIMSIFKKLYIMILNFMHIPS